ncbi:competence protein CoiA family protein [Morganella morganii]
MPLKALLNNELIYSFMFDEPEWLNLKKNYKNQLLKMECCGHDAIPKISQLGNFYFAHKKRGECSSASESMEHLYLKYLVARLAYQHGWTVNTESHGETPDGEKWIADVYCEKDNAKIAFEIQISQQSYPDFKSRTNKYAKSNVRCMWLYKISKRTYHFINNIPSSYEYPVFAIQKNKSDEFIIPQFKVSANEFISGVFLRKLKWHPERKRKLIINTISLKHQCRSCGLETNIITGLDIFTFNRSENNYIPFNEPPAQKIIRNNIDSDTLLSKEIGEIKFNTRHSSVYCFHCKKTISNKELDDYYQYPDEYGFYDDEIDDTIININDAREKPIYTFYIKDDDNYLESVSAWFFDNKQESRKF